MKLQGSISPKRLDFFKDINNVIIGEYARQRRPESGISIQKENKAEIFRGRMHFKK